MQKVISHLQRWKTELSGRTNFESIPEKAEHIGLMNSIEVAIKQLELCQTYGINPGSWFCVFPEQISGISEPEFRVISAGEGDGGELFFPGHGKVCFRGGDLAIKR